MSYYLNENDYPDNYDFLDDVRKNAVLDYINTLSDREVKYLSLMDIASDSDARNLYTRESRKACDRVYAARKAFEALGIFVENLGSFTGHKYALIDRDTATDYNAYLYDITNEQREDHDDED